MALDYAEVGRLVVAGMSPKQREMLGESVDFKPYTPRLQRLLDRTMIQVSTPPVKMHGGEFLGPGEPKTRTFVMVKFPRGFGLKFGIDRTDTEESFSKDILAVLGKLFPARRGK